MFKSFWGAFLQKGSKKAEKIKSYKITTHSLRGGRWAQLSVVVWWLGSVVVGRVRVLFRTLF